MDERRDVVDGQIVDGRLFHVPFQFRHFKLDVSEQTRNKFYKTNHVRCEQQVQHVIHVRFKRSVVNVLDHTSDAFCRTTVQRHIFLNDRQTNKQTQT